jgi:23S rRNA (cytidine1920-2'-O)/16S rRNA (cytidine1409-2'-O)-methyltransferase
VDCLLQNGAAKVYGVDRGYGVLAYPLRTDHRVVVMERTDALGLRLPEFVRLVTVDTGWTRQRLILPAALRLLDEEGSVITLVKPQYEADAASLSNGVLPDDQIAEVLSRVKADLPSMALRLAAETESPIRGRGGNREFLWWLKPLSPKGQGRDRPQSS